MPLQVDPRALGPADDRDHHVGAVTAADDHARAVEIDVEPRQLLAGAAAGADTGRGRQLDAEQLEQHAADSIAVEDAGLHQPVAPKRSVLIQSGS